MFVYDTHHFMVSPHAPLVWPDAVRHAGEQAPEDDGGVQDAPGRDPLVVDGRVPALGRQVLLVRRGGHPGQEMQEISEIRGLCFKAGDFNVLI